MITKMCLKSVLLVFCTSDRMVRPSLFRDRISNLTNLFRPEPNRTRQDIHIC